MSVPKVITVEWLEQKQACTQQVRKFKKLFGEEVTLDNPLLLVMADQHGMNIYWLRGFMTEKQYVRTRTLAYIPTSNQYYPNTDQWVMAVALVLTRSFK